MTQAEEFTPRAKHLEWCKQRARGYLAEGDGMNAVTSMLSDLQKHPETRLQGGVLTLLGMKAGMSGDIDECRRFIEGFN